MATVTPGEVGGSSYLWDSEWDSSEEFESPFSVLGLSSGKGDLILVPVFLSK